MVTFLPRIVVEVVEPVASADWASENVYVRRDAEVVPDVTSAVLGVVRPTGMWMVQAVFCDALAVLAVNVIVVPEVAAENSAASPHPSALTAPAADRSPMVKPGSASAIVSSSSTAASVILNANLPTVAEPACAVSKVHAAEFTVVAHADCRERASSATAMY